MKKVKLVVSLLFYWEMGIGLLGNGNWFIGKWELVYWEIGNGLLVIGNWLVVIS